MPLHTELDEMCQRFYSWGILNKQLQCGGGGGLLQGVAQFHEKRIAHR